jgi:bifunctional ADP-heptose synthase (sugar kinase/adenylyltransferase)
VLVIEREERRIGGAGNVQEMVHALGAQALLFGIVGEEDFKTIPATDSTLGWFAVPGRTMTKTRSWVDGRLTGPRIDIDNRQQLPSRAVSRWKEILEDWAPNAIIIADHGKGVVTSELLAVLGDLEVPLFIDPIQSTPSVPRGRYPAAIVAGPHEMPAWYRGECIIWKKGAAGLHWCDGPRDGDLPSACRNLVDPLGAGDQFIAALAYQRCLEAAWPEAIEWANAAAGIQCECRGCVPITADEVDSTLVFKSVQDGQSCDSVDTLMRNATFAER